MENVKGEETFTEDNDGRMVWQADGKDIYYQGKTDKELPVTTEITYTLDGNPVQPDELAGKSGHLKIDFSYINHEKEEAEELMKALSASPEFLELYLKQQSDFSKTLNFKIKLMTIGNARDRFLYYLTFYNKQITYKSVTKLAKELYLTRESLSRTMYKMAKDGEIKIENKTITLK